MAKKTPRIAWPASMLAKSRTESETRRKTSLTAWITKISCLSTGGALGGAQLAEVAHGAVLADAGVVREDEREQGQAERDVQVRGGGVEAELPVLGERQRDEADEVRGEDEEEGAGDVREPRRLAALHDRADDAVAGELVERLDGELEARRRAA